MHASSPQILLISPHDDERAHLQALLQSGLNPPANIHHCNAFKQIHQHLREHTFDVLLIVIHPAAQRRIALDPALCELALTGPQPLLLLRDTRTLEPEAGTLPTLNLTRLSAQELCDAIDDAVRRRRTLRERLRGEIAHALVRGEMELRYQPVLDVQRDRLDHVEVLLRWRHPLYGLMGPKHFLDIAESSGAIHPLGVWVLRRAHEQQLRWTAQGLPLIPLSINVADCQLEKDMFANALSQCLQDSDDAALDLELSAASLAQCSGDLRRQLTVWHDRGVHLTADQIGDHQTAASLQGLPLDALKLDRRLLQGYENDPSCDAALKSALELGQSLGCDTIAAGVEKDTTATYLHGQHCDHLQGFWVSRPLSGGEMAVWAQRFAVG